MSTMTLMGIGYPGLFNPDVPGTPATPDDLVAEYVYDQINLTWDDNSSDELGFEIERSTDSLNWTLIETTGPDIESYVDTDHVYNITYYYRVRAFTIDSFSNWSNIASVTVPDWILDQSGNPIEDQSGNPIPRQG